MFSLTPEARQEAKLFIKEALQETLSDPNIFPISKEREEILLVPRVAALLHCSEDQVRDLAQSGKIPCCKPGKNYFFIRSELFEWIRNHRKNDIN